jgi:hypothetical protein
VGIFSLAYIYLLDGEGERTSEKTKKGKKSGEGK